jgi:gentisate 1,2-dioxygenase
MSKALIGDQHAQLKELYSQMERENLYPLWEVMKSIVHPEPVTPAVAALWRYNDMRRYLMRAGTLISAEQAERRVLILENPGMPGQSAITPRLYAGLQLILPGEVAPCHRHSQAALRFIMEGSGAYTAVDGERAYMRPFDLILTPSLRWHDHGNATDEPVIWLDGLDIPTVRAMDGQFAEHMHGAIHEESTSPGTTRILHGRSLRPMRSVGHEQVLSNEPLFHYPYIDWSDALNTIAASTTPDPYIGHALEFLNPRTGGPMMATISAHVRSLPAGFETGVRRSTEGAIFTIVEGEGTLEIDGQSFEVAERDVVVVPTWKSARWSARSKLVLFCFSDRVTQEALGLYRESLEPGLSHQ